MYKKNDFQNLETPVSEIADIFVWMTNSKVIVISVPPISYINGEFHIVYFVRL